LIVLALYFKGKFRGKRDNISMNFWLSPFILSMLLVTAACGVAPPESVVVQSATMPPASATATDTPVAEPTQITLTTAESAATPRPETIDWLTIEGKTADNLPYLGNPDAPVTIIDYSDFL
jgi:protein-disulfide isomerase